MARVRHSVLVGPCQGAILDVRVKVTVSCRRQRPLSRKERPMPMARVADANIEHYFEGSGPPILLISGFTAQASGWNQPFVRLLQPHFQVIRYSHRGIGTSDHLTGDITLNDLADDAAGLLSALGIDKVHVLGVSMGGMI